jgi:membrane protein CcdC involved in cytochrome C biogenesis
MRAVFARLADDCTRLLIALIAVAFAHAVIGKLGLAQGLALLVCFAIAMLGYIIARLAPGKWPDLFYISAVAMIVAWPGVPGSALVQSTLGEMDLLATMTPLMAFAALGLGNEEFVLFRKAGLAFILVGLLVFLGTFLGSAIVAEVALRIGG